MRLCLTLLFSLVLSYCVNAQIQVINRSLTNSSLNYLYIGVDNELEVNWNGMNSATAAVSISGAESSIMKIDKNRYIVRVNIETDSCRIRIYQKGNKEVFNRYFKCRIVNDLVARLGNQEDTVVSVRFILTNPFISVVSPGCYYDMKFRVTDFSATFIHDPDSIFTATRGNLLTNEQIYFVKQLLPGDQIYFHHLRGVSPDSGTRALPSFRLYIK